MHVRNWVWKTTIKLQEELRDFIVQSYKDGNLYPQSRAYTDPETFKVALTEAAFKSHSKAYVSGGLTIVALLSPNFMLTTS